MKQRYPRLREVVPTEFAAAVVSAIAEHATRLAEPLAEPWALTGPDEVTAEVALDTAIGERCRRLAEWARSGALDGGRTQWAPSDARAVVDEVVALLYGSATSAATVDTVLTNSVADTAGPVEVVLLAALARARLADGGGVPDRELAALAGIGGSRIRQLAASGELRRASDGTIRHASAVAYLAEHGVAGFAPT